ncbi:DNA polymerase III subunit alpha [Sandaracinobacteroides saxicola]|uniref:DNA polymerase III subunit alpha n=1 Tax=Sandaracinobacteroides saxicola TaxID=2759707 RepID=A0A7G5IKV4_9SPHN|nr:DNA polymerase III subunit alpha [Sandaracinobacteroides saxicola]QMW23996.1 DNA polymerase III subunit alpha [Sandaracinobacteroides saxicola]
MAAFVPLRAQSCYSMLDSTIEPKALAKACAKMGMPAVALCDRANLFAAMEFSDACLKEGVQPIIGVALPLLRGGEARPGARAVIDWLPLLAQDEAGYANLLALVSAAHLAGEGEVALPLGALEGRTAGLIALTGGADGALARLLAEGQDAAAADYADALERLFPGRLYVEISRSGEALESASEAGLLDLAYARDLPLVASNVARFLEPAGHEAHDVMLCIADGAYVESDERRRSNPEHWLKPADVMARLFADLPEALANTLVVARRCAVAAPERKPILPRLVPDRAAEDARLAEEARAGLAARLAVVRPADAAPYEERLAFELGVIAGMGFSGYFLIVADFIGWAKARGIPVGPGRGSGAGSVVAWALLITDLDPLEHGLIFERFLNPERVSMPDFDIDFCETRRGEVIDYVQARYGRDHVAQIITFGKLKARAVLKDVGRVMQLPYGQVDRLAKLVPNVPADPWSLDRTLAGVPELRAEMRADAKVARLVELARSLEGLPRHSSTHAAGVVIGDRPLDQLVPLYRDPRSDMPVSQFDLKWVEKAGLVKFDFLGLKTLSVLARAKLLLGAAAPDLDRLPWADDGVFALMTRGDTVGVFQFESEGMRRALNQVRPTCFEDIIALGALYRPGPMDNIPSFAARKWGREEPDCLHPMLEPILKPTYGVIIYQEQVMQIAQVLAGYSLGEADLLRRAMGKKIQAEMDAQRARFVDGAVKNGVAADRATFIFNLVDKFAGYGFNKSHAAAYALVAWQTAWLKVYHPAAFFAASMAYDISVTDKLAVLMDDARRMKVRVLPPCLNRSGSDFTVEGDAVRYALGALKGVGEAAMAALVAEREANGPFRDIADFVARIDARALNRRQLEALAGGGAFDALEPDRARVFAAAEAMLAAAARAADARASGQGGLFGGPSEPEAFPLPGAAPWKASERLAQERAAFGFYFSGHPVEAHGAVLAARGAERWAEVSLRPPPVPDERGQMRTGATMAGLIEAVRWRVPNGKGADKRYLVVDLTDAGGAWQASCFEAEVQPVLEAAAAAGTALLFSVELSWRPGEETPRVAIRGATPLDGLARTVRTRLIVSATAALAVADLAACLPRGGRGELMLRLPLPCGDAVVRLGRDFAFGEDIIVALGATPGVLSVESVPVDPPLRLVA